MDAMRSQLANSFTIAALFASDGKQYCLRSAKPALCWIRATAMPGWLNRKMEVEAVIRERVSRLVSLLLGD